jgi:hypothetical protein
MNTKRFPKGWNEKRIRDVLEHYERQTEEEAVAEDEAAFADPAQTAMLVPAEIVPAVRELIAIHQNSHERAHQRPRHRRAAR